MKILIDTVGSQPTTPDFGMLRAALIAAQAATPTAIASARARVPVDPVEGLTRLFGDRDETDRASPHGTFHRGVTASQPGER